MNVLDRRGAGSKVKHESQSGELHLESLMDVEELVYVEGLGSCMLGLMQ